jgi:nicotinamide mononucleotide transporter PnuC
MLKNPFRSLTRREWILWGISLVAVLVSNFTAGTVDPVTLAATLIGVTALIFVARGDVWGQILTVVFSILYSITSWRFGYYGEIITYLCMSAPIAAASVVTWLKHPYKKDRNEVKIHHLSPRGFILLFIATVIVTVAFYFILGTLGTTNLIVSTFSVSTSFLAASLLMFRSSYYAVAYAANDVVLIILWVLASFDDPSYIPMVVNFAAFLANDLYGFLSWKAREKKQAE